MSDQDLLLPTAEDLEVWSARGFVKARYRLSEATVFRLRRHCDDVFAGVYETGISPISDPYDRNSDLLALHIVDNPHWADSAIRETALDPMIGSIATELTGANSVQLWATQLLRKQPGGNCSGMVGWHQDMDYWLCAEPAELLTAWIALDDTNEQNGALEFIPGSHKGGHLELAGFLNANVDEQTSRITQHLGVCSVALLELKAGEMTFHHCLTLHHSAPNVSFKPRRGLSIHMMPEYTRYHAGTKCDRHVNVRLLDGRDGDRFPTKYFPVIYRKSMVPEDC